MSIAGTARPIAAMLLCFCSAAGVLNAQPIGNSNPPEETGQPQQEGLGLHSDRKVTATLDAVRTLIPTDVRRAVEEFRRLQSADPRLMVPAKNRDQPFQPLFQAAFDIFHQLPPDQRRRIADRNQTAARIFLAELLADDDLQRLPELFLKAAGTAASYEARFLIARLHDAQGHRMAARLWLQPLLHPAVPDTYRRTADQLLEQLTSTDSAEQSTAVESVTLPAHVHWQIEADFAPQLQQSLQKLRETAPVEEPVETTWTGHVSGPLVLRRTLRGVAAVQSRNGQTAWHYRLNAPTKLISSGTTPAGAFGGGRTSPDSGFEQLQQSPAADLFCRDNITGHLTVDDNLTYAVTSDRNATRSLLSNARFSRSRTPQKIESRMVALDTSSGRRIWSCGIESLSEHFATESTYCWIFGPARATPDQLLCMVEWDNEIFLAGLRRSTGEPVWSVPLAFPSQSIPLDPVRQLWTAIPDYHEGLAWCNSTTGWTFGVDTVTQTVIWADFIGKSNVNEKGVRVGRGRPVELTQPAELSERWTRSLVQRVRQSVVTCPHATRHLLIRDALSGTRRLRRPVPPGTLLLHVSEAGVLFCEPNQIPVDAETGDQDQAADSAEPAAAAEREQPDDADSSNDSNPAGPSEVAGTMLISLSASDGSENWSASIPKEFGTPTASGAVIGGNLIVPTRSGRLLAVNLQTGTLRASATAVLPTDGWGALHALDHSTQRSGDLLYAAPNLLMRLSDQPNAQEETDPIDRARNLAAAGKWREALMILNQMNDETHSPAGLGALRFRLLHQLAQQSPEEWLEEFKASATTPTEQVQAILLEARWQIRRKQTDAAVRTLVQLLQMETYATRTQLQQSELWQHSSDDEPRTQRTIRSAAIRSLNRLLTEAGHPQDLLPEIRPLPDDVLLQLHHPVVRSLLHERITPDLNEANWHLLRHAVDLAANVDGPATTAATELKLAAQMLHVDPQQDGSHIAATRELMQAAFLEFPASFRTALRHYDPELTDLLPSASVSDQQFRQRLQQHFRSWPEDDVRILPVLRNTSINTTRTSLIPATRQDPFLRQYRWTASRGDAGRLQGQNLFNSHDSFSVPGTFDVYGVYSNRTDILHRCGTVLLLQSYRGLAAVSVLDQQVLWSLSLPDGSAPLSRSAAENFATFNPYRDRLPSQNTTGLLRIVGAENRWICVVDHDRLQMLDLLNGTPLWSFRFGEQAYDRFLATDDIVVFSRSADDRTLCFDRRTGAARKLPALAELVATGVRAVGTDVVSWKNSETEFTLEWWNPVTDEVRQSITLPQQQRFTFLDDRTLIGFDNNSGMLIVDLLTAQHQSASFALPEDAALPPPPAAAPDGPATSEAEAPAWSASRLHATFDGWNYLVANRSTAAASSLRQTSGRKMFTFSGGLRAVSSQTGQLAWHLENSPDQHQLATTDQPELPLLLIIEATPVQSQQGTVTGVQNVFRGIRRMNGRQVFRHPIPSRFGLRYTSFTAPDPHRLSIGLYGRRIEIRANPEQ